MTCVHYEIVDSRKRLAVEYEDQSNDKDPQELTVITWTLISSKDSSQRYEQRLVFRSKRVGLGDIGTQIDNIYIDADRLGFTVENVKVIDEPVLTAQEKGHLDPVKLLINPDIVWANAYVPKNRVYPRPLFR